MKARLRQIAQRIDAMSLRERVLIFAMVAAALFAVMNSMVLDPLGAERKRLANRLGEHQHQIEALSAQSQALAAALRQDPDAANRARLEALHAQLSAAEAEVAGMQENLVPPAKMAQLLRDLVGRQAGLGLVGVKTLPPRALEDAAAGSASERPPAAVYVHGVELTIEGSYADLLAYLGAVERMRWRVYWGEARLAVQRYPLSQLTLTLYTLSLERTWLSV